MDSETLGPYRLLSRLGAGGMGEVYEALDPRLGRRVAIKVLHEGLASDADRVARFEREARAAAALTHPHIVTLYSVEEAAGRRFLTMELVEGHTLEAEVVPGGLPLGRLLEIGISLADALAAAHQRGIIHRDLKPGNVMLDASGRIKVLDFGLAKLEPLADATTIIEGSGGVPTREGALLGTFPYMAPEQLRGEPASSAVDLFALGVVLFELGTGRRPFTGATAAEVIGSILRDEPPALKSLRPDLPAELGRLVRWLLEKDARRRLQSALDLRNQLEELRRGASAAADGERVAPSIAVLPFDDMSPERDQDYFCEGIAEELINALTRIDGLRVASRISSFNLKGKANDAREIGERLGVSTLLEGSVRKAGDRLRITVQLIDTARGYHLWSERYDRKLEDVFAIQDEIAERVVAELRGVLTERDRRALQQSPSADVRAYELYLRGRKYFYEWRDSSFEFARQLYERAIDVDPAFALAYAGIADCCSWRYGWYGGDAAILEAADAASRKALELAPNLAEAHASRGLAISLARRCAEAAVEFEEAIRLNPRLYEAHYFYARCCFIEGKLEDAAEHFERAAAVRPEDYQARLLRAMVVRSLGREADAVSDYHVGLESARRHLELHPEEARAWYLGASSWAALGEKHKAREWAAKALALGPDDQSILYNVACAYSLLGDYDEALDCLENILSRGFGLKRWILHDGDLDPVRSHSRFQALLAPGGPLAE